VLIGGRGWSGLGHGWLGGVVVGVSWLVSCGWCRGWAGGVGIGQPWPTLGLVGGGPWWWWRWWVVGDIGVDVVGEGGASVGMVVEEFVVGKNRGNQ
jgi:hypothetical protein